MSRTPILSILLTITVLMLWAGPLSAKRLALLVGNQGYPDNGGIFKPLSNPRNDAQAFARLIGGHGFQIAGLATDVTNRRFLQEIKEFIRKIEPGDEVLFYYSGHGIEVDGENYLIPVDSDIQDGTDIRFGAVSANRILTEINSQKPSVTLMVLDACRDNVELRETKGIDSTGFAKFADTVAQGAFIGFASAPGKSALGNRNATNSFFTEKLMLAIEQYPHLPIELVFKRAREMVINATNRAQWPWSQGSIVGDFCFANCSLSAPVVISPPAVQPAQKTTLTVLTQPAGAQLYIDRRNHGQVSSSGKVIDDIQPGTYSLNAKLDGYVSTASQVQVLKGQANTITLTLTEKPEPQIVQVPQPARRASPSYDTSFPTEATITVTANVGRYRLWIDGDEVSTGTSTHTIPYGEHHFTARSGNYPVVEQTHTFHSDAELYISFKPGTGGTISKQNKIQAPPTLGTFAPPF